VSKFTPIKFNEVASWPLVYLFVEFEFSVKKTKMNLAFLGKLGGFIAAAIFIHHLK
jgi:hypothetical protein